MGSIPSGFGIISGFDTATLIEQMLAYQAQGRSRVEARIGLLQARRSAMLDINAGLLAMANTTASISSSDLFQTIAASSSHPSLLGVNASANAAAGLYQFTVAGLASNHQLLSSGFASQAAALGLMSGSIELGQGGLSIDMPLSWLNGGDGVNRGEIEITNDDTGEQCIIDLRDVATLDEVMERINGNSLGISAVLASGGIQLESEGQFEFSITSVGGSTTAQDLGINGSSTSNVFQGNSIALLGGSLSLAALNDGNGVLVRQGLADIRVTSADGRIFDIDLSQGQLVDLTDDTLLSALNGGSGVFIDQDSDDPDLSISVVSNGSGSTASWDIDLTGCVTIGQVRDRIESATSGSVSLDIRSDGQGLSLVAENSADLVMVEGAGVSGTTTADGLGILNESGSIGGFDGSDIAPVGLGGSPSIQAVLDAINSAVDLEGQTNNGAITARLSADNQRLELVDTSGGAGTLLIQGTSANATAYRDLGFEGAQVAGNVMTGHRIIGGPGTVLVHELHGGSGLGGADSLTITDRFGTTGSISGLSQHETIDELVHAVNAWAIDEGLKVELSMDASGTGLELKSRGGSGTFTVTGDLAEQLGLNASGSMDSIRSGNLQHRWVSESMDLADLNQGRGIGTGTFRIRDELGATATVTITSGHQDLQDVIDLINSRGLAIEARVNDQGDGLALVSTVASGEAIVPMQVETTSGTAAADLNLVGESASMIDGSWETALEIDAQTTLQELVDVINASGAEVTASLVNTGDPANPWRLNLTSSVSGAAGQMVLALEGLDADFEQVVAGRDAKLVLGDDVATGVLITSSSNRIEGVIQGLTIDLLEASDDLVTITVERDDAAPIDAIRSFVDNLNAVLERLDNFSGYDPETGVRGVLNGDSTTSRIRNALRSAIQGRGLSEDFSLQGPWEVGIRMGAGGRVEFNEEAFAEAWANDRDSVEAFFTSATEDAAGSGFGTAFNDLTDRLTRMDSGTLVTADRAWEGRIDLAMSRLERLDARLEARRSQLLSEFMAMEEALASMQNQYMALMSISSGTAGQGSLFG